jgi:N-methylhydantoinase A
MALHVNRRRQFGATFGPTPSGNPNSRIDVVEREGSPGRKIVPGLRVAVDVGGTFTDLATFDEATGRLDLLKVPSRPQAPEEGVLAGVTELLQRGTRPGDIGVVLHVGTVGTNLFRGQLRLEMPKVALVTTEGFRDVLEIGRQNRPELYNVFFQRPKPLVPRRNRFEVPERVGPDGEVLAPLNRESLAAAARRLREDGCQAVAVAFLHSYANPIHEREAKAALGEALGIAIVASSDVDPEHREYERTSTTVVNAVLLPVVGAYLSRLEEGLGRLAVRAPLYILSSSGGLLSAEAARGKPVASVESGPAAGVVGAATLGGWLGLPRILSLDMGGTTAKAGCVLEGKPLAVSEYELGGLVHAGRAVKGSGYPIRYPSVDLAEVSAGGGTILRADDAGVLRVGPVSAGADPGPACYGRGGTEPTITDANRALGRLGEAILGGTMPLRTDLAMDALEAVGERTGLDPVGVAASALRLINVHMSRAVRLVSLERGLDPRDFALMAFGGAGPMHAAELADELGIAEVLVPPSPGLFSSIGLLFSDLRYDYVRGMVRRLDDLDVAAVEVAFSDMEAEASAQLARDGYSAERAALHRSIDLRYAGQGFELTVSTGSPFHEDAANRAARSFHDRHRDVYGYAAEAEPLEVVALRLAALVSVTKPRLARETKAGRQPSADALRTRRKAFFGDTWHEARVYERNALRAENRLEGPAIVEQYDATTVVPPGWIAKVDELRNLRLRGYGRG